MTRRSRGWSARANFDEVEGCAAGWETYLAKGEDSLPGKTEMFDPD